MKFFIDVQGTLIDDIHKRPIPGSIQFIDALNEKKIPYAVITNNTKQKDFLGYLQDLGFCIQKQNYIDPLMVLQEVLDAKKVAPYGIPAFIDIVASMGYVIDYLSPEAVVLSVKANYSFDEFAQIDEFLLQGAKLFGMHQTSLYVHNGKRYPGVGALLEMFAFATKVEYQVVGKPSRLFFQKALQKIGGDFHDVTIISDDPQGDLEGAKRLGMQTVFVLSGKFKSADEIVPRLTYKPDMIAANIFEAGKLLGVV